MWDGEHIESRGDYTEKFITVDEIKHGPFLSWYNKTKTYKEKGLYEMGDKVGVWTEWYSTGEKMNETNYSKYDPFRLKERWHENGQLESKTYYNRKGDMIGDLYESFYENGQQESRGRASRFEDGVETTWYENGQLHIYQVWEDGKLLVYERYEEDGSACQFTTYKRWKWCGSRAVQLV